MSSTKWRLVWRGLRAGSLAACCLCVAGAVLLPCTCAAGQAPAKEPVTVKEEELARVRRVPSDTFQWRLPGPQQKPEQKAAPKTVKTDPDAAPDMTAGDVLMRAAGDLLRLVPNEGSKLDDDIQALTRYVKVLGKEILMLRKGVEIEQLQTQSVLRGEKIVVVRNLKNGQTELLEATGKVELVTPERKGLGEHLVYLTEFSEDGQQVLRDEYTLEGDRAGGKKATLWQGGDVIEAMEFFSDRRRDTFRVRGGPVAVVTMPATDKPPAGKPEAQPGILPGFGTMTSGKIKLRADGEMFYEGPGGHVRITRNVVIQQDAAGGGAAMIMSADEALLTLLLPPPGQPQEQASVFTGSLKTLECKGRVEIKTPTQTVLCDRGVLDMQRRAFLMEMKNPKDDVKVYTRESAAGGKVMLSPRSLKVFLDTNELQAGGPQRMEAFSGPVPTNRTPPATK